MLQWIHGKAASAVRMRDSGNWLLVNANERPQQNQGALDQRAIRHPLHLGLVMQLRRLRDEGRKASRGVLTATRRRTYSFLIFGGLGVFLLLFLGSSLFQASLLNPILPLQKAASAILDIPISFWIGLQLLVILEWGILQTSFSTKRELIEWSLGTLRIQRVAWELSPLMLQAIAMISLTAVILAISGYLAFHDFAPATGVFLAAWLYLILVISPFGSTPASHIFNRLLGIERILQIQDQFLLGLWIDRSQALKGKISWVSHAATFSIIAWIALVTMSFGWIADSLSLKTDLQNLVLQLICNVLGLSFCMWTILKMIQFIHQNSVLRRAQGGQPFQPTQTELNHWQTHCALIRHLPQLSTLPWEWHWYKAGTMLIRRGETNRTFYWLASGEASILGLDSRLNNVQFATLHGGSGFGEIVFFHGGQRNADVYLRTDSIVASLNHDAITHGFSSEQHVKMELLILASQAMDASTLFHAMPSHAKEEWLASASFHKAEPNETLIAAGSDDTWMGLVIHGGSVRVARGGKNVAKIEKGGVFGEMAHWTSSTRSATIIAEATVHYLRWEPWFWAEQVKRHNLETHLEQLIQKRSN